MSPSNQRRMFVAGMVATAPFLAAAQKGPDLKLPYEELESPIPGQANRVALFYSYTCPYCRQFHPLLSSWAATVPSNVRILYTPLPPSPDLDAVGVIAHYAVRKVAPSKLRVYESELYERIGGGANERSPLTYLRAADKVGISPDAMRLAAAGKDAMQFYARCVDRIRSYNVTRTPSVGICGLHMVSPDNANQDPESFLAVINGLLSQCLNYRV